MTFDLNRCRTGSKIFKIEDLIKLVVHDCAYDTSSIDVTNYIEFLLAYYHVPFKILLEYAGEKDGEPVYHLLSHHLFLYGVKSFINNEIPIERLFCEETGFYTQYNGMYWKDLPIQLQRPLLKKEIEVVILEPMMSEEMKDRYCRVFDLINKSP